MMDIITYGLSVAVVGMLIVFAALVILIALITVMNKIVNGATNKKKPSEQVTKAASDATPIVIQTTEVGGDEIVAVITAAITAMMDAEGSKGGFVVRSIRRVGSTAPAWNRAGREEQVYSRM